MFPPLQKRSPGGLCHLFLIILLCLLTSRVSAEDLTAVQITDSPKIDGHINDEAWQQAAVYDQFITQEPINGQTPTEKTLVYVAYTTESLFFAFRCFDSQPEKITASLTKRDNIATEDKVGVFLDLYHDQQSAIGFLVNPLGVQEDVIADESFQTNTSEDFVWYAAATRDEQGYSVEIQIPLKSIRYPAGDAITMGIVFRRRIVRLSEWDSYPPISRDQGTVLSQLATITYRGLPYKRTFEVLPSATYAYTDTRGVSKNDPNVGITTKIGLSSAFLLDATVYPDFNQVEADASQVEFNERSAVIYDEKRPFFLEGTDNLFVSGAGDYNNSHVPVVIHTRKIIDPIVGLKLTGRPGKSHVIAAIAASDQSPKTLTGQTDNAQFGIVRYKKLLNDDSYVGALATTRELSQIYSRMIGADGRYRITKTTSFQFDALHTRIKNTGPSVHGYSGDLVFRYHTDTYQGDASINTTSTDFDLATGFVNRQGIRSINAGLERTLYPPSKFLINIKPAYWGRLSKDTIYNLNEYSHKFYLSLNMPRLTEFHTNYRRENEVFANQKFDRSGWEVFFSSRPYKIMRTFFYFKTIGKPFFDATNPYQGDEQVLRSEITFQPTPNIAFENTATRVRFHKRSTGEEIYNIHILRGKLTYQANKYLFFRTIGEYNDAQEHITTDFLASFTYIPGTVCHIGYGTLYEKDPADPINTRRQYETAKKSFFIKAAYNWRL